MHSLFQNFVDRLSSAPDADALRDAMAQVVAGLDLSCFAYLSTPHQAGAAPQLISTYPSAWTAHYLRSHYERIDPVVVQALKHPEPFEWGLGLGSLAPSKAQQELFEEAARFGIICGFTVPIHSNGRPVAAVTFAAEQRRPRFDRSVKEHALVLQLIAIYFHTHARRRIKSERTIGGVSLSCRELECLEWAAQGKSAWEMSRILGISRRTAAFHLDNAKAKLGVHSICQAVARLIASRSTMQ